MSEDFFNSRMGQVTASRISDVLAGGKGITRDKYKAQLVAERMSGKPHRSNFTSASMQHGTEFEVLARMQYEIRNDVVVIGTGKEFVPHHCIKRSGASPDGFVNDDGLVEIKCTDSHTFVGYKLSGEIPSDYRLQMTWQLACTQRKWCDFVAYDPDFPEEDGYLQIRFTPTEKEIIELETAVIAFDEDVNQMIKKIIEMRPQ